MDEVSREGRQLIDSVRRHDGLDPTRREQLKRGVMLGVGGAVGAGTLGIASQATAAAVSTVSAAQLTSSAGAAGLHLTFGKLLLIAATAGTIGMGLVAATLPSKIKPTPIAQVQSHDVPRTLSGSARGGSAEKEPPPARSPSAVSPTAQFPAPSSETGQKAASSVQVSHPGTLPTPLKREQSVPLPPENGTSRAAPLPSVGSFTPLTPALDQELQTIRTAQRALREGKGQEVLDSLNQGPRPQVLTEEYAATRVFALCSSGRVAEAQSAARAFLSTYPRSPLRPKVASACSGK